MSYRIKLSAVKSAQLFNTLAIKGFNAATLSDRLSVSSRTIRDWKRGKYTVPIEKFKILCELANIKIGDFEKISENQLKSKAGRLGGSAYINKYKIIGDITSRQKGGLNSFENRKNIKNDIYSRDNIIFPPNNNGLAEFIGIVMGDGGISQYQVTISLDSLTDNDYVLHISKLCSDLFGKVPTLRYRKSARCAVLTISSINLVNFLVSKGMKIGNKHKGVFTLPDWIRSDTRLSLLCIRGLMDTDGSIFQEIHKYNSKTYYYPRMMLVSKSLILLEDVADVLSKNAMNAKVRGGRCVSIERFTDISKYFTIVGSSNQKHLDRWAAFGGVG